MKKKYFGTDGIRGIANEYPIIPSFLKKLAFAIFEYKKKIKKNNYRQRYQGIRFYD